MSAQPKHLPAEQRRAVTVELPRALDSEAAAILFIGTVQGLIMQSLLAGDVALMHRDASRVFQIYRRGIETTL